jgi:hypothetical protein
MNIIQTIRSWFFGKEETIETPETPVIEAPAPVEVKPTVKELVAVQETPAPKPKRKYYKKKKSTGESK